MENKNTYPYKAHKYGRIAGIIAILIMFSVPIITGIVYNAMPSWPEFVKAMGPYMAIFAPIGVAEAIAYTPIVGSGIYICFITGNLGNLKVPLANRVIEMFDLEPGSEKADVCATMAIAISSIVTIIVLLCAYFLLDILGDVIESSTHVRLAIKFIIPAIFGSLFMTIFPEKISGGVKIKNRSLIFIPVALIIALSTFYFMTRKNPIAYASNQGVVIILGIIMVMLSCYIFLKKGVIEVIITKKE